MIAHKGRQSQESRRGEITPPPSTSAERGLKEPAAEPTVHRVPAAIEAAIAASGLPWSAQDALRTVARARAPLSELEATIEELIDHVHCSLERGRDLDATLIELGSLDQIRRALEQPPHRAPTVLDPPSPWRSVVTEWSGAVRSLRRAPAFLAANVVTLGLGLAAAVTLFALFDTIVLRPLPFDRPEGLYELRQITETGRQVLPSYPNFADLRERTDLFESVVSTAWGAPTTILGLERPTQARTLGISRGYFASVGIEPILGRPISAQEHAVGGPPAVVVSEEFWRSHLGASEDLDTASIRVDREASRWWA